jgi:mono/diheme cytochrome c family protein
MRALITATAALALAAMAYGQAPTKIKQVTASDTNAGSGMEMFHAYCATCHGGTARGDGPAAAALKKAPADLTLLSRKNGGRFPALEIANTIRGDSGMMSHGSREMPVWGDVFKDLRGGAMMGELRVKNLTDFIQTLQQK